MPTLTLNPTTVEPGQAPDISGTGYGSRERLQVLVDGASKATFRASKAGAFGLDGLPPTTKVGSHAVVVQTPTKPPVVLTSGTFLVEKAPPPPPADTTPPTITNIVVGAITTTGATIGWSLSEPGTGQVEYGPTTAYGTWTTKEPGLLTAHKQVLSGLTPGTTYHFRIHSADAAGNANASFDQTFVTAGNLPGPPPPPVSDDIQKAIDAAPAGSFLDLTGAQYSGIIKVAKSLHIKGGAILGPASGRAYVVDITGTDVELEAMEVTRGFAAIVPRAKNTVVHHCTVKDIVYAGIFMLGQQGGRVYENHIDGVSGSTADGPWNAYGITASFLSTALMSKAVVVEDNLIEHIPVWHGLDTHGGIDIVFRRNTIRAVRRAIWSQNGAQNLTIEANDCTCPTAAEQAAIPAGAPVTFGTDVRGISLQGGSGSVRNNTGHNYPASRWFNPIGSVAGYSFSGNNPVIAP